MKAVGYVRVSTAEQAEGGLGLHAQRDAIRRACRQRHWDLASIHQDALSGGTTYRPGLIAAVESCASADVAVLVVAKLDRLVRSLTGYAALVERAKSEGWRLLALDTPETDTPQGEAMQAMTAVFAQLERRLISQRTKEALAAARDRGVRLGRPPAIEESLRSLINELREQGLSARATAAELQRRTIAAPHGGVVWHASTVIRAAEKRSD